MSKIVKVSPKTMLHELSAVDLGDDRRKERLLELIQLAALHPDGSIRAMCEEDSQYEGAHRLLRNPRFEWTDILEPHIEQTAERARKIKRVLVLNDTTKFKLPDTADMESYLNTGKKGFLGHFALAVDGHSKRKALGVVGAQLVFRQNKKSRTKTKSGRRMNGAETAKLKNKEYDRWYKVFEQSHERLSECDEVIHVMDREGDCFGLMADINQAGSKFVVRWCRERKARLAHDEAGNWGVLSELLQNAKTSKLKREVPIEARKAKTAPAAAKRNPARDRRTARLQMSRLEVVLKRPPTLGSDYPAELKVNVVRVWEPRPPEGQKPVSWILLTNLSVQNSLEAEQIVDIYCERWLIEEFFQALKTGCSYKKRQLTNRQSILNTMAMLLPIAWRGLLLRNLARAKASCPASEILEPDEEQALRAKAHTMRRKVPKRMTAADALDVIAAIGGHKRYGRPPGWKVLMRGVERFEILYEGWALASGVKK